MKVHLQKQLFSTNEAIFAYVAFKRGSMRDLIRKRKESVMATLALETSEFLVKRTSFQSEIPEILKRVQTSLMKLTALICFL